MQSTPYYKNTSKINLMQVDDNQQFIEKRNVLMNAVSKVVNNLLKQSGKSGRKISQEYEFGLGMLSKLQRNIATDIKLSTVWKLANTFELAPQEFILMIQKELPQDFNFYD